MNLRFQKYSTLILLLSIVGVFVSAYATYQHYRPAGTSFCNLNNVVSCDIVNKSKYAETAGVPVAIIGMLGYLILTGFALMLVTQRRERTSRKALVIFSGGALLFSFYLTFVELFWLQALCLLCITSQIIILLIFVISLMLWRTFSKLSA